MSSWEPSLYWFENRLWALSGKQVAVHDGEGTLKVFKLCDGVVGKTQVKTRYYYGLFVDQQGAVTIGKDAKERPVMASVSADGELHCETRKNEYFVDGISSGGGGVWKVEVDEKLVLRTARGKDLPAPPGGVPTLSRAFAPAKDKVWLEIWASGPVPKEELVRTLYFDGKSWRKSMQPPGLPLRDMTRASDGRIWALTALGLAVFDGKSWQVRPRADTGSVSLEVFGPEVWIFDKPDFDGATRSMGLIVAGAEKRLTVPTGWSPKPFSELHTMDSQGRLFMIAAPPPGSKGTSWLLHRFDPPAKTNL